MSKKFVITSNDSELTASAVKECLTDNTCELIDRNITVEELPQPPEVKKSETGILMSPADICGFKGVAILIYDREDIKLYRSKLCFDDDTVGKRLVISEHTYPREFYRKDSIETTWDFSSIPVGSLIEVDYGSVSVPYYGKFQKVVDGRVYILGYQPFSIDSIKSIRIVELPKE